MNAEVPLSLPPPLLPDQNIFRSPEEMQNMQYTYALLDKLAVAPSRMPAYMRDLARRGGGVTGLGQDLQQHVALAFPRNAFFRQPRAVGVYQMQPAVCVELGKALQNLGSAKRQIDSALDAAKKTGNQSAYAQALNAKWNVESDILKLQGLLSKNTCGAMRGFGAVTTKQPINLQNPDVMREVKTLMALIKPHYAEKGEAWFGELTWTPEDWVGYKSIAELLASSLESSADEKKQLVAYIDDTGKTVLGWPADGRTAFPSAIGISGMGEYLIQTQVFPDNTVFRDTFPALDAYSAAGVPLPPDPGVVAPKLEGGGPGAANAEKGIKHVGMDTTKLAMIAGGVAVVGVVAFLLLKKKRR